MAKYVVVAKEMFTDLVRAFGKGGKEFRTSLETSVAKGLRRHNKTRDLVHESYMFRTGKPVPENKVVLKADFLANLERAVEEKKRSQTKTERLFPRERREQLGLPSGAEFRAQKKKPKLLRSKLVLKKGYQMRDEMGRQ
jgi:hypothetical protein